MKTSKRTREEILDDSAVLKAAEEMKDCMVAARETLSTIEYLLFLAFVQDLLKEEMGGT